MENLHQTPLVIFCYIAPVQWTLSEVLVNQATGQGKWWGNLLKHQHWRLLWNMWISFQIEAIKWVLLLFDLPPAKVREHIHVLHVEGCIPSPFDLGSWRGHTMRTPKHGCMYVQTTDFAHFLEIILPHGFLHFSTTVHNLCPFPTEVITGFDQNSKTASVLCYFSSCRSNRRYS